MTYADIEAEMGLKPASARQLVRRNGWRRIPGNDGRTRIEVPVEELERDIKRGVEASLDAEETDVEAPVESPIESPFEAPLVTALTSHIERLERALADAETSLSSVTAQWDEARSSALAAREEVWMARGQIDVLKAQIEAEKARTAAANQRAEEVSADRDRWHTAATVRRRWWQRRAG
jgi:chromosome segregation ATPase